MIILINSKLTDNRLWHYERYNLHFDDRMNVAKYCFASFAPLAPIVSKFLFYLDVGDFAGREQELEQWVAQVLPQDKVELRWNRLNNITQWREAGERIDAIGDDIILPGASWEDHIFWDNNLDCITEGIELIRNDPDVFATVPTSHYPECMRYAVCRTHLAQVVSDNYVGYMTYDDMSQRIMKTEFFRQHLAQPHAPDAVLFRVEQFFTIPGPMNRIYQPTRELLRHFDGYSHVGIGGDIVPPISIPPRFFDNSVVIRYGFDDYEPSAVNINPLKPLRTVDPDGTDYRFTLEEMPLFWRSHIKDIQIAPDIDHTAMKIARNQVLQDAIQLDFSCGYGSYTRANPTPTNWIDAHLHKI